MKLKSISISKQANPSLLGKNILHVRQEKKKREFPRSIKPCQNTLKGFTILEVMVALAIVGISIGIFFSLIGNSSRLRDKIDRHAEQLLIARSKTEEAFLGILGKKYVILNEKKTFEGTTKDGVPWKITETNKHREARKKINMSSLDTDENMVELPPRGTTILNILVEGINIETVFFPQKNKEDSLLNEDKDTDDISEEDIDDIDEEDEEPY